MLRLLAGLILAAALSCASDAQPVPLSYFGLTLNYPTTTPWPPLATGTTRTWGSCDGTAASASCNNYPNGSTCSGSVGWAFWAQIETSSGVYTWTHLDAIVAQFQARSQDIIFTLGYPPGWATGNGGCAAPPSDLTSAGSPNATAFATAVATRYCGKIGFFEIWNEPYALSSWTGTIQQMNYIAASLYPAVKAACPSMKVLSPTLGAGTNNQFTAAASGIAWTQAFLSNGGGVYFDIYNIHAYPWQLTFPAPPEFTCNMVQQNLQIEEAFGLSQPLWITELDQGGLSTPNTNPSTPQYTSVAMLLPLTCGAARTLWFAFDNINFDGNLNGNMNGLNASGVAYKQLPLWVLNGTFTAPFARVPNTNQISNTTMSGAVAGTPGTLPTGWSLFNPDTSFGISTQVVGTGTVNGVIYLKFRVFGTATAGATGALSVEPAFPAATPGQTWTLGANISLAAGSLANLSGINIEFNEFSSGFSYLQTDGFQFTIITPLEVDKQSYSTTAQVANASAAFLQPAIQFSYPVGSPIDVTIDIASPFMDNGTIWSGNLSFSDGSTAQIAWDSAGGPTSYATSYGYYRDLAGLSRNVVGSAVTLTGQPIYLNSKPLKGW